MKRPKATNPIQKKLTKNYRAVCVQLFFIIVCFCYCYCLFVIVVCYCYRAVCVQLSQVNRVNEGDVVGRMPIQAEILIKMFNYLIQKIIFNERDVVGRCQSKLNMIKIRFVNIFDTFSGNLNAFFVWSLCLDKFYNDWCWSDNFYDDWLDKFYDDWCWSDNFYDDWCLATYL